MSIKEGYTRVSDILKPWTNFGNIDPEVLENKARIGTSVHSKISLEMEGIFIEAQEDEKGYYSSWESWAASDYVKGVKFKDLYLSTENRFYCDKLMITGQVDALLLVEGKVVIIDYKTSASVSHKNWVLQGCFYNYLAKVNGFSVDDAIWFIHLKKTAKKASLIEYRFTDELWDVCASALKTFRHFNG